MLIGITSTAFMLFTSKRKTAPGTSGAVEEIGLACLLHTPAIRPQESIIIPVGIIGIIGSSNYRDNRGENIQFIDGLTVHLHYSRFQCNTACAERQ
jgi:hypothetical protein